MLYCPRFLAKSFYCQGRRRRSLQSQQKVCCGNKILLACFADERQASTLCIEGRNAFKPSPGAGQLMILSVGCYQDIWNLLTELPRIYNFVKHTTLQYTILNGITPGENRADSRVSPLYCQDTMRQETSSNNQDNSSFVSTFVKHFLKNKTHSYITCLIKEVDTKLRHLKFVIKLGLTIAL